MKTPNDENIWCNVKGKHTNHVTALTRDLSVRHKHGR